MSDNTKEFLIVLVLISIVFAFGVLVGWVTNP